VLDLDKALVAAIIKDGIGSYSKIREFGINPELLSGSGKIAFDMLAAHVNTHGALPTAESVYMVTSVKLPDVPEPALFYAQEIINRAIFRDLHESVTKASDSLAAKEGVKPIEILDHLEAAIRAVRQTHNYGSQKVESIPALFKDVVEYYDLIKSGKRGILTPWNTINEETLGFWPEDLALFVARVGIGKTWTAALLAYHAWKAGKTVLFATTEISQLRIAQRFAAIHFNLPYGLFRKGQLDAFREKQFKDGVQEILKAERLYVIGGAFDIRVESYQAAVEQVANKWGPENMLSIFDGAYLLKVEGKNRIERAANAFDELKRVCKRTKVPNAVTMQFNREVKANEAKSVRTESIALTDVAAWNADLIYGLIQTEDMKRDKRMIFKPLKVREGVGEDFEVNWDLDTMNFTELPKSGGSGDGDDPFGTGADHSGGDDDVPF
jgi:replicative DNA helicase